MKNINFKQRLKDGQHLVGTIVSLPSPEAAELLSQAGFDWLFLDAEHSAMDPLCVQRMLQAVGGRCACVVRVPSHEEAWIKKVLDMGPDGIIVPLVNDGQAARRLVDLCRYPPQGARSVGIARAHGYGLSFLPYIQAANKDTALIFQVEHIRAVENVDSILESGLDAVFVGPYDLSASMGKPGQVSDPDVMLAIERVRQAAVFRNIPLGIFGTAPAAVLPYLDQGFTLAAVGTDCLFMLSGASTALKTLKG